MNAILYWNEVADAADKQAHGRAEPERADLAASARAFAITHLAMHDALATLPGARIQPFLPHSPAAPSGTSDLEVVSGAAHRALCTAHPQQSERFDAALTELGVVRRTTAVEHGASVAARILRLPDRHCLSLDRTLTISVPPPPQRSTRAYVRALREVQAKGVCSEQLAKVPPNRRRTNGEALTATFWGYYGTPATGSLARLLNGVARSLASRGPSAAAGAGHDLEHSARLLALTNCAMADAAASARARKNEFDFWRPVDAVREHDCALGANAHPQNSIEPLCDPDWRPQGIVTSEPGQRWHTPSTPAYPSERNASGAAALHAIRLFFGVPPGDRREDELFDGRGLLSEECDGTTRDEYGLRRPRHIRAFPGGLWQMIDEIAYASVLRGVNWRLIHDQATTAASGARGVDASVTLGLRVAEAIFARGLHPP